MVHYKANMLRGGELVAAAPIDPALLAAPELPPIQENPNRHFGPKNIQTLRVRSIINLSQVRHKTNPRFEEIRDSIDSNDLDNQLNVARVDREQLAAYIAFTNNTWGNDVCIEDYDGMEEADGLFNLAVAGHTRLEGIIEIADKYEEESGYSATAWGVDCKILEDPTILRIVAKQLEENLHSNVAVEREAVVIVESYYAGLGKEWSSPAEYQRLNSGKVSKRLLYDALMFAQLSSAVRTQVFSGRMPFKAGVELGRATPMIREWFYTEVNGDTNEPSPELEYATEMHICGMVAYILNRKLNSTAATMYIRAATDKYEKDIALRTGKDAEGDAPQMSQDSMFDLVFISAAAQAREVAKREEALLVARLKEMQEEPFRKTIESFKTLKPRIASLAIDVVEADLMQAYEELAHDLKRRRHLGEQATLATMMVDEDEALAS